MNAVSLFHKFREAECGEVKDVWEGKNLGSHQQIINYVICFKLFNVI